MAKELGVKYVEQKFTSDQVAEVDTQALVSDNAFERWLRTVSYTGTQDADLARALDYAEDHSIAEQNRRELLELAKDGAVIRGRNGAYVLNRAVGSLHVRLTAPIGMRIERVTHKTGLDRHGAESRIAVEDQVRAEMSRNLYGWNPHTDEYYDLVINTGTVTYKQVVEMIVAYYRSKYPQGDPTPPEDGTSEEGTPEEPREVR